MKTTNLQKKEEQLIDYEERFRQREQKEKDIEYFNRYSTLVEINGAIGVLMLSGFASWLIARIILEDLVGFSKYDVDMPVVIIMLLGGIIGVTVWNHYFSLILQLAKKEIQKNG